MKIKTGILTVFMALSLTPFPGLCQSKYMTTKFREVDSIPAGKALIYIYRSKAFTGSAVHYSVNVNDVPLGKVHLYNGGYMVYFAEPGTVKISAEVAKEPSMTLVNAEAGKTYYVKGSVRTGTWVGRPFLETVDIMQGRKEIQECKLLKQE